MARYFFHVHDHSGLVLDPEGQDLDGPGAVMHEALRSARAIMAEDVAQGVLDLRGTMEVADAAGRPVLTLRFDQAIQIRTPQAP